MGSFVLPALVGLHLGSRQELDTREQDHDSEEGRGDSVVANADEVQKSTFVGALSMVTPIQLLQWLVVIFGIVAMIALLFNAIYDIATADYTISSAGELFCEVAR